MGDNLWYTPNKNKQVVSKISIFVQLKENFFKSNKLNFDCHNDYIVKSKTMAGQWHQSNFYRILGRLWRNNWMFKCWPVACLPHEGIDETERAAGINLLFPGSPNQPHFQGLSLIFPPSRDERLRTRVERDLVELQNKQGDYTYRGSLVANLDA